MHVILLYFLISDALFQHIFEHSKWYWFWRLIRLMMFFNLFRMLSLLICSRAKHCIPSDFRLHCTVHVLKYQFMEWHLDTKDTLSTIEYGHTAGCIYLWITQRVMHRCLLLVCISRILKLKRHVVWILTQWWILDNPRNTHPTQGRCTCT